MKKNDKRNIKIIIILLVVIIIMLTFYFIDMRRFKILTTVDFSSCKETCNYNLMVGNKVYKLKYIKTETQTYPEYIGKVYLNDIKIMESGNFTEIRKVTVFKDLLIFEEHVGPSADGYSIKIYNNIGKLIININLIDEKTGMHIYYDSHSKKIFDIVGDKLIINTTIKNDDGYLYINGKGYMETKEGINDLIDKGLISYESPYYATYSLSYDDILNNKELKLFKVTSTLKEEMDKSN